MSLRRANLRMLATVLGIALVFGLTTPAFARREIHFEILLDSKVILHGRLGDDGRAGPDEVWGYLRTLKFTQPTPEQVPEDERPAADFRIQPEPDRPLQARLRGKIRIFNRYGGDIVLTELQLVRSSPESEQWQLAPAEVARTAAARTVNRTAPPRRTQ